MMGGGGGRRGRKKPSYQPYESHDNSRLFFLETGPKAPAPQQQKTERTKGQEVPVTLPEILRVRDNCVLKYFKHQASCFKAGRLKHFYDNWQFLTSDTEILKMIAGQSIEFSR